MHRPPKLEFKTVGGAVLDAATTPALEYKTATGAHLGAVIDAHTENDGEEGVVEAYVAVTGTRDEVGDVIEHGAFNHSLKTIHPKMCLGHDWNRPIGQPEEIRFLAPGNSDLPPTTADGNPWPAEAGALYTKNRYMLDTEDGRNAYAHAKFFKQRTAYSIGYVVKKFRIGLHKGLKTRFIEELDLYEYGPVLHGAHNLARQKSVKTGEPTAIEHKLRKVKDAGYWGYPVGTPITAAMRPKGKKAVSLRKEGRDTPRNLGTDQSVAASGKPAAGRGNIDALKAQDDANGLFPEPDTSQTRLRATSSHREPDVTIQSMLGNEIDQGSPEYEKEKNDRFSELLAEGHTPQELEQDLRTSDVWPDELSGDDRDVRTGELVDEYRVRYQRALRVQNGQGGETPGDGKDTTPTVGEIDSGPDVPAGDAAKADAADATPPEPGTGGDNGTADAPTPAATSFEQAAPPKVKKGENLHTVTMPSGQKFYRGSKRDYTHAVVKTEDDGSQWAASFHGSESGANGGVAELRRRGHKGTISIHPVDANNDGQPDSPAVDPNAPENADAVAASPPETPAEPDKTRPAMWKANPDRAAQRLGPAARAEYTALSPARQDDYARARIDGEDHATALGKAAGPKQLGPDGEPVKPDAGMDNAPDTGVDNSTTETGIPAGGEPAPADNAPDAGADKGDGIPANADAGVPNADAPKTDATPAADLTPEEQAWASDAAAAADAQLDEEQRAAYDTLDDQGKRSYATARISGENHDSALDYAQHRSDSAAPAAASAPENPPVPGELRPTGAVANPSNLANTITSYGSKFDLAPYDLDMLKATDAEFADRAKLLGKPGGVSKSHQLLKDEIAKREAGDQSAEVPAAGRAVQGNPLIGKYRELDDAALATALTDAQQRAKTDTGAEGDIRAIRAVMDGRENAQRDVAKAPGTPSELPAAPNLGVQPGVEGATEPPPALGEGVPNAGDLAIPGADVTPGAENVQTPAQQGPSVAEEAARTLDPAATARLSAEDVADANTVADASFGVTEADDGEFEVDTDVADRQDRVATLLTAAEGGNLDLGSRTDGDLRTTRTDVVNEIKLQDHLVARRDNSAAPTRAQRSDSGATGSESDADVTDEETAPAPRVRPGVAGAAEDFADALESGNPDDITRTQARLESSLRRSKSDSEHVSALRALVESGGDTTPEQLRAAADAIRVEARTRRNEQARNRRTARRLDRERLRSLLGQVDAEMRRRNLSYDPVPGLDGDADATAPAAGENAPGTWAAMPKDWTGTDRSETRGTGYHAVVTARRDGTVDYAWQTRDGNDTLTEGSGSAADADTARVAVAQALAAQQTLGRVPGDSVLPPLPQTDTVAARQRAERSAVDAVRARLDDPKLNPLTGVPNPLAPPQGLATPATPAFTSPAAVRAHMEANPQTVGDMPAPSRNIRWDDVKLTPGGGLAVVTDLKGQPMIIHAGSGANLPLMLNGRSPKFSKADLYQAATLIESMPDADGRTVDFAEPDRRKVGEAVVNWKSGDGQDSGFRLVEAAASAVILDKLRRGRFSDPAVRNISLPAAAGSGTNPTRDQHISDLNRNLSWMLTGRGSKMSKQDKETVDIARAARNLADAGAPDAAAVLLRRHAVEVDARGDGNVAEVLGDLASTYLSRHSPAPSPGSRALRLQPGERLAFPDGEGVRTYRVITPVRGSDDRRFTGPDATAQVMDEATGQALELHITGTGASNPYLSIHDTSGAHAMSLQLKPLGGDGFVVLDADEAAPDADGFKAASFADVSSVPNEVLDRAAEELPETSAEKDTRRAAAPPGGRAPARRSAAAPRRKAPEATVTPTSGEASLARAQTTARGNWVATPVELTDAPLPGGFKNFDGVIANAEALQAKYPAYRDSRSSSAIAAYIKPTGDELDSQTMSSLPEGGAKLSPGGHFVVRRDGTIEHAHTGSIIYRTGAARRWGLGDLEQLSPAAAMRFADYLERADYGGQTIPWATTDTSQVTEAVRHLGEVNGEMPLAATLKTAFADHMATVTRPTASDISSLVAMTNSVDPLPYTPNPDVLTAGLFNGETEKRYRTLGGARVLSGEGGPANTREGQTLAKRIGNEYALTREQAKVSPLDTVRRLNALADELDGRTISDNDGTTVTPSNDLRARAKAITDAFDESKPSPMGQLARNGFAGTVVPDLGKADISVGRMSGQGQGYVSDGTRNVRQARLKTELAEGGTVKFERGDSGSLRATLAGRTVEDGVDGGQVRANPDGSLAVSWREDLYNGAGEPKVRLPAGAWKLDAAESTAGGMSDAEYEAHTADIEAKLGAALSDGQATDVSMTIGRDGQSWTPERAKLHNEIVDEVWQARGATVPTEGRAVIAGGLGGAGKSTVLKGYAGIDATQYFTINPDDVKEAMAARDMIPSVEGLSPMEASPLAHEESSHIANLLAARAYASNTNVVWDITMSREASVKKRIAEMRRAGYTRIDSVFVDIPVDVSAERALARHRRGMEQQAAGEGSGGRYVPPSLIRAMASDTSSSANRDTFDTLKPSFDSWIVYDNSVAGQEPQKVADSGNWGGESQTATVAPKAPENPGAPEVGPPK